MAWLLFCGGYGGGYLIVFYLPVLSKLHGLSQNLRKLIRRLSKGRINLMLKHEYYTKHIASAPPLTDWLKLNIDGSVQGSSGKARCGGVVWLKP